MGTIHYIEKESLAGSSGLTAPADIIPFAPRVAADQLRQFVDALFRYATPGTYVSLRSFYDEQAKTRALGIPIPAVAVQIGDDLEELTAKAIACAGRCADFNVGVVFAPPIATFDNPKSAKGKDIADVLVLSVECDERAPEAVAVLSVVLGPPTLVMASGGNWIDPDTGEITPKLHAHWRLSEPATTPEDKATALRAREYMCRLVGADVTAINLAHPMRWAGSLHRKDPARPRLARIVELNEQAEVHLGDAFDALDSAAKANDDDLDRRASKEAPPRTWGAHLAGTAADLESALEAVPNADESWELWVKTGMAIWVATGGSDAGRSLFHRWSSKSGKYDAAATDAKWDRLTASPPERITAGSIYYRARLADPHWTSPSVRGQIDARRKAREQAAEQEQDGQDDGPLVPEPPPAEPEQRKADVAAHIAELNKTYALLLAGNKAVILREGLSSEGEPTFWLLQIGAFHQWLAPQLIQIEKKMHTLSSLWISSPRRREYEGLVFAPNRTLPRHYNLWKGFAVEPKHGDCSKFIAHIKDNVCSGNQALFEWVIAWLADIVQHPDKKSGTSLCLRGKQGVGKTTVGYVMRRLLGDHYTIVSDPRYISGRFNAHMISCLLLHADEGFWAGDKAAEGRLKDLVTGDAHQIEFKGIEPIKVRNYVRLLVTGNSDWLVPAGMEERRFCVIDVSDEKREDHKYFGAIEHEMDNGGAEALLDYLLNLDLSAVNLRQIPKTDALLDQKVATLSPEQAWWIDTLMTGCLPTGCDEPNEAPTAYIYDAYILHTQRVGVTRRAIETKLGMFLTKAMPKNLMATALKQKAPYKNKDNNRVVGYVYRFPPLAECRAAFGQMVGQDINWPDAPPPANATNPPELPNWTKG